MTTKYIINKRKTKYQLVDKQNNVILQSTDKLKVIITRNRLQSKMKEKVTA